MSVYPETTLKSVLNKLNIMKMLELISYRTDTVQESEDTIRCYCPIHKEVVFRTLIINTSDKGFRCSYSLCAGHKGGDLILLYALATEKDYDECVDFLVDHFGLDVELPTSKEFVEKTVEIAENYLELGALDEAEHGFKKVISIDSTNLTAQKGLLEVYTLLNNEPKRLKALRDLVKLYAEHKEYKEVIEFGRKVLEKEPEDVQIQEQLIDGYLGLGDHATAVNECMMLADTYESKGKFAEALSLYRKIDQSGLDVVDVYPHIIQVLVAASRTDDAVKETVQRAERLVREGSYEQALEYYKYVLEIDDTRNDIRRQYVKVSLALGLNEKYIVACLAMVDEMLKQETFSDAVPTLNDMITEAPNNLSILNKLSEVYESQGKEEERRQIQLKMTDICQDQGRTREAVDLLEQLLTSNSEDTDVLGRMAAIQRAQGEKQSSSKTYRKMAEIFKTQNRYEEAVQIYQSLVEIEPKDLESRREQIQLYLAAGNAEHAVAKVQELIDHLCSKKQYESAIEEIARLIETLPDVGELHVKQAELFEKVRRVDEARAGYFRAHDLFKQQGQLEKAAVQLERILASDETSIRALQAQAELQAQMGDGVKAVGTLGELATSLIDKNDFEEARGVVQKILEIKPDDLANLDRLVEVNQRLKDDQGLISAYTQQIEVFLQREAFSKVVEICQKILAIDSSNTMARLSLIRVYELTNKPEMALEQYCQLAEIYRKCQDREKEREVCEKILTLKSDDAEVRRHYCDLLLETGQMQEACAQLEAIVEQYCAQDDFQQAVDLLQQYLERSPEWAEALVELIGVCRRAEKPDEQRDATLRLIKVHEQRGELANIVNLYHELLVLEPQNFTFHNNLIHALLEAGKTDEAKGEYVTLAQLYCEAERYDDAEAIYREMLEQDADNETVHRGLITLYRKQDNMQRAIEQIYRLSSVKQEQGAIDEAISVLREIIEIDPQNVDVRHKIIDLDKEAKQVDDALKEFAVLYDMHMQNKELEAAVAVQKEAVSLKPDEPTLRRVLTDTYLKQDNVDEAVEELFALVDLYNEKEEYDEAMKILGEILELDPQNLRAKRRRAEGYARLGKDKKALEEFLRLAIVFDNMPVTDGKQRDKIAEELQKFRELPVVKEYSFDQFVVGDRNNFAFATAMAVAKSPARSYNPLFFHSDVGLGKTHLLHAIANYVMMHNQDLKVLYTNSEEFTSGLIDAIQNNTVIAFRNRYKNTDVLLLDDVQFLAGKERAQEEFFHIFNTLFQGKKQIVLTSDRPPKDIAHLEKRLRSRFGGGVIVDIQPPDFETRTAILHKDSQAYPGIDIADDVFNLIAERIQSNVRDLKAALNQVIAVHQTTQEQITLNMAKRVLESILEKV